MTAPAVALGVRTDLALLSARGSTVQERGGHRVVRTQDDAAFRWGNCIRLAESPAAGSATHWRAVFAAEFPGRSYVAIGVDRPNATLDEPGWRQAGFEPETEVVLTAEVAAVASFGAHSALPIRRIDGDAGWAAAGRWVEAEDLDEAGEANHLARRMAAHRRAAEAGAGAWFGAFDGDRMVAGLGLFVTVDGDARYQHVGTRSDWRRQGLAGALLRRAAAEIGARDDVRRLVIVADPLGPAVELYRRTGFADAETQVQLESRSGRPPSGQSDGG